METDIQIKLTVPERGSQSGGGSGSGTGGQTGGETGNGGNNTGSETGGGSGSGSGGGSGSGTGGQTGGETGNGGDNTGSETGGGSSNQANTGGGNSTSGSENPSGNTGSEIAESQTHSESSNEQSVSLQENQGNSLASTNNSNTLSSASNKYSIAVPNTGGKTSDNHGSVALTTTFTFLVIILGIVFLAKRIKNKHRSSRKSKKSSFVIKHNPLKLATTSLALLAVAFFGISFFAHAMKDSSASAAGDDEWSFGISVGNSAELGRGDTGATTHTVTLPSNSSVEWRFMVQADSSTLNLNGDASKPGIPSVDGENQTLGDSTWGYSVSKNENANITGEVWSQIPTTETTIRSSNDGDEDGSSFYIHYGAKIAADESKDNLGPGSYSTGITYSVVADNATPTLGTMQDFTADECTAMNTGDSRTLRDLRDDNTYTIKKLADGKCWMTQDLAIMDTTISSVDSNLPAGTSFTLPASVAPEALDFPQEGSNTEVTQSDFQTAKLHYDRTYGVVYNYYAATGGAAWWCSTSAGCTTRDGYSSMQTVQQDICPKGWRLPTGASSGEYMTLLNNYDSPNSLLNDESGPQFTLAGYYNDDSSSRGSTGESGHYWSSTIGISGVTAFGIYVDQSEAFRASNDMNNGYSMRCVAKLDSEKNISDISYMQDITPDIIEATPEGTSATLTDKRDGKTYTVKKLLDGNIWMTQNLALIDTTITSEDSNIPAGTTFTVPASSTGWGTSSDGNSAASTKTYDMGGYGVLYNYATASAGTSWYGGGVSSGNLTQDICPKGWRLPTGGTDGEFAALDKAYGGTGEDRSSANTYSSFTGSDMSFVLAGDYGSGGSYNGGTSGYYWSSSQHSNSHAHYLFLSLSSSRVGLQGQIIKNYGISIRCVAEDRTLSDISYMQDMTPDIIERTPEGASATLTDTRDGKTYTVKKLNDGKIWMRDFLKLSNKTISSADSNISSGSFTIPSEEESNNDLIPIDESSNPKTAKVWFSDDNVRGFLYNYYTLSAGTSWYGDGYGSKTLDQDICPKGWHIPSSDNYSELMDKYSDEETFKDESGINSLLNKYATQFGERGAGVFIWNSDTEDGELAYEISAWMTEWSNNTYSYHLIDISTGDFDDKRKGGPIQCVAE